MNDKVFVVIEIFAYEVYVVGATIDLEKAQAIAASAEVGCSRFIKTFENGVEISDGGSREE